MRFPNPSIAASENGGMLHPASALRTSPESSDSSSRSGLPGYPCKKFPASTQVRCAPCASKRGERIDFKVLQFRAGVMCITVNTEFRVVPGPAKDSVRTKNTQQITCTTWLPRALACYVKSFVGFATSANLEVPSRNVREQPSNNEPPKPSRTTQKELQNKACFASCLSPAVRA